MVYTQCGGCPQYQKSPCELRAQKSQEVHTWLHNYAPSIQPTMHAFEWYGFRDRCDLQYEAGTMGLYQKTSNNIVAITHCPKVHKRINQTILWLHNNPLPIKKASLRIRRAPDDTIGIWIDTSNINISTILKEESWLVKAQKEYIIELGQKHKRPKKKEETWGLNKKPVLFPWFETLLTETLSVPIYCTIASFTQPSMKSNQTLVRIVQHLATTIESSHWLEYGCGSGNFTFMLSQIAHTLELVEINPIAKMGLKKGLKDISTNAIITFANPPLKERPFQSILLDPPRSGMGHAIQSICTHPTCTDIIYVSCSFQSMKKDLEPLLQSGFTLVSMTGVDQFPKSNHCEWIAYLSKN